MLLDVNQTLSNPKPPRRQSWSPPHPAHPPKARRSTMYHSAIIKFDIVLTAWRTSSSDSRRMPQKFRRVIRIRQSSMLSLHIKCGTTCMVHSTVRALRKFLIEMRKTVARTSDSSHDTLFAPANYPWQPILLESQNIFRSTPHCHRT